MSNEVMRARAILDAWREQGADRMDPIRFRFIEALARRAADHRGEAARVLERRLGELVDTYAADLERATLRAKGSERAQSLGKATPDGLAALVNDIRRYASMRDTRPETQNVMARSASYPELPMLDDFREIWSRMSAKKQLRQSLAQVPGNAGPLNSSSLVHRSLSLMQTLSPGYLQQFLAYIDALSWMEQMTGGTISIGKGAPRVGKGADAAKKPRGKHA